MVDPIERYNVRPLRPEDVEKICDYIYFCSPDDIERMGLDLSQLPPRCEMESIFQQHSNAPFDQGSSCYLVWEVDGRAIGFTSLKDIIPRQSGGMHLHMWEVDSRGKGFGSILFCKSAMEFYRRCNVELIVCEPRAANPYPNRMLAKVGFPLVKQYVGRSSSLSAVTTLNRYEIRKDIAERYLQKVSECWPR